MTTSEKFTSYKTQHRTTLGDTVTTEHDITADGDETGTHITLEFPEREKARLAKPAKHVTKAAFLGS